MRTQALPFTLRACQSTRITLCINFRPSGKRRSALQVRSSPNACFPMLHCRDRPRGGSFQIAPIVLIVATLCSRDKLLRAPRTLLRRVVG